MKKLLLILLVVFVVIPLLIGGYLGLVPGLSTVFGSDKPRDLGVKPAQMQQTADSQNGEASQSAIAAKLKNDIQADGSVATSFTSEELTALARQADQQKFSPVSSVQVRLNDDSSIEASGYIDLSAENLGEFKQAISALPIPSAKVPFYLSLTATVIDNKVETQIHKLELARVPIPVGLAQKYLPSEFSLNKTELLKNNSITIETLEVRDGQLHLEGMLPK